MQIDYLAIVVVSVCAITFYRTGVREQSWGILWAGLSVSVSLVALHVLKSGLIGVLVGQILVFGGITVYRVVRQD